MKKKFCQIILILTVFILIVHGKSAIYYAKEAMQICYDMIIPTLFPFFVCSGLLITSGFCDTLSSLFAPLMRPLFNVSPNGSTAFVLGIISGYPLGAVTVCRLYEEALISKAEAEKMLGFCNNSGPLFILGSVGIGLYSGLKIGVMLYSVHIFSALLTGFILRFINAAAAPSAMQITVASKPSSASSFGEIMETSVKSILNICGTVIFFSVISKLCIVSFDIGGMYSSVIYGILEFASGIVKISESELDFTSKMVLSAFVVGFAGISVHLQVLAVVSKYHLSMRLYLFGKFLHGLISSILILVLLKAIGNIRKFGIISLSGGFAVTSACVLTTVLTLLLLCAVLKKAIQTSKKCRNIPKKE